MPDELKRLTVGVRPDQADWLQALPYGLKQPLFQALIDDLMEACSIKHPDGTSAKYDIIGAYVNRTLRILETTNKFSCSKYEQEKLK